MKKLKIGHLIPSTKKIAEHFEDEEIDSRILLLPRSHGKTGSTDNRKKRQIFGKNRGIELSGIVIHLIGANLCRVVYLLITTHFNYSSQFWLPSMDADGKYGNFICKWCNNILAVTQVNIFS